MTDTPSTIVRNFTDDELNTLFDSDRKHVTLSGHCFSLRKMKNMIFIVLRKHNLTIQCILMQKTNGKAFQVLTELIEESVITITGNITKPPKPIESCDVHQFEVFVHDIDVVVRASKLPFFVADANEILVDDEGDDLIEDNKTDADAIIKVSRIVRLQNRWLDLRATNNYIIVQLRSALVNAVRRVALDEEGLIEVSTPKIIPAISESGSQVFSLNYFDRTAYLAQSPQLYKQMMINSGMRGVFEVGPIFRAENSMTYRHLCEFTGLDMEFPIEPSENHYDIVRKIWSILYRAFENFYASNTDKIEVILGKTHMSRPIIPEDAVIVDFCDGVNMLAEAGFIQSKLEDIGSIMERELGKIVKEKYKSDLFVLINYPSNARPFYTMVDYTTNTITGERTYSDYSRSFDFIFRGSEILSGAQRNHNPDVLKERIKMHGITLDFDSKSTGLEDYVRSFEHGSMPHGGCGIGVERLVMLYLGLPNVRSVSLFPRDPKTINP